MQNPTLANDLHRWLGQDRTGRSQRTAPGAMLASDTGYGRVANEDRVCIAHLGDRAQLAVVADGMGGMQAGAECAALAVTQLVVSLVNADLNAPRAALRDAVRAANEAVYSSYLGHGGTTLSVVLRTSGSTWLAHVGDSRIYALETGGARQLTVDHTALAQIPDASAARLGSRQRLALGAQLTRAIGIEPQVDADLLALDKPRLLLTTDGVHDYAGDTIDRLAADSPENAIQELIDAARESGSGDDATLVKVDFTESGDCGAGLKLWDAYGHTRFEACEIGGQFD